jgi:hypothetical protein
VVVPDLIQRLKIVEGADSHAWLALEKIDPAAARKVREDFNRKYDNMLFKRTKK